jgi:hypothetical protein
MILIRSWRSLVRLDTDHKGLNWVYLIFYNVIFSFPKQYIINFMFIVAVNSRLCLYALIPKVPYLLRIVSSHSLTPWA